MKHASTRAVGDRKMSTLVHAAIDSVGDGFLQQTFKLIGRGTQCLSDIEHLYPFGMRTFLRSKTSDEEMKGGMLKGGPVVSILLLGGNQSNTLALPAIDRRFGPMGLKEG